MGRDANSRNTRRGLSQTLVSAAKPGQQLAVKPDELVAGHGTTMWVLPVERNPALHPHQRLVRLAACDEYGGEGMAVLGGEPGLSREGDLGREVSLREVDRTQNLAPTPAKILGFAPHRVALRRLDRARSLEARANLSLECGQSGLVERLGGILLDVVTQCVGVVVHPRKQPGSRLVRVGARRLPGFDPFADEIAYELSKGSARIVEFFSLRADPLDSSYAISSANGSK